MSMDGLTLMASVHELQSLCGGKVNKVYQPEPRTLVLEIRAERENFKLLLCAHPENGRAHITQMRFINPPDAPAFCMLLRKRLIGGRVRTITQPGLDRILKIEFETRNDLEDTVFFTLIVELMGKHSNITLVDADYNILDCIHHVGAQMSSVRMLLPGIPYSMPPAQDKMDPRKAGADDFYSVLTQSGQPNRLLSQAFSGLSPAIAQQLILCALPDGACSTEAEKHKLAAWLHTFYAHAAEGRFSPTLVTNAFAETVNVYPFTPSIDPAFLQPVRSMGEALDLYYEQRDTQDRLRRNSASLQRTLQNTLERCYHKLEAFENALSQQNKLDQWRLYGELLSANVHRLQRGMKFARVENYYLDPPDFINIPLDERLSPQENAQQYFKKYQKGKAAKALAGEQKRQTLEEIAYLEGQLDNIGKCALDAELNEIRNELEQEGYVKRKQTRMKMPKQPPSKPMRFVSSDGIDIYVGKNNQQNDALTLRFASSDNFWLHTKNIPGSHVIIRYEGEPPKETILEAALLAAYYSKARLSASVSVDYCPRKNVKKPSGAKPGMVIYDNYHTAVVTPEEADVKALKQIE